MRYWRFSLPSHTTYRTECSLDSRHRNGLCQRQRATNHPPVYSNQRLKTSPSHLHAGVTEQMVPCPTCPPGHNGPVQGVPRTLSPKPIMSPLKYLVPGPSFLLDQIFWSRVSDRTIAIKPIMSSLQNLVYLPGHYLSLHTRDLATFGERHIYIRVTSTFEYLSVVRQIE